MITYQRMFTTHHDPQFNLFKSIVTQLAPQGLEYTISYYNEEWDDLNLDMICSEWIPTENDATEVKITVVANDSPGFAMFKLMVDLNSWRCTNSMTVEGVEQ